MSILALSLHLEEAIDLHQLGMAGQEEIRLAAHALLAAARDRWRCPSCGVERTGKDCKLCHITVKYVMRERGK